MLQAHILSDGPLQVNEFNYHNACLLRDAEPWGQGFAEPLFDGADQLTCDYERIAYRLMPDEWRGNQAVQLMIEYRCAA
ncbi:hypothetical protein AXE65_09235 [Ventosimonas gracilis]|uniref:Uncharacterized protein n=1 Tax=Ventosimonas gracilis TaxID=1680762 RepID=A0A139SXS3_9GAMM|nr:hypothetical protein AXE65_09235 [Ventosimonas gracilis]